MIQRFEWRELIEWLDATLGRIEADQPYAPSIQDIQFAQRTVSELSGVVRALEEQLEARQTALDEVFRLIWIEDAPYVEGGSRKLDEWAERNQALATPYEERARAVESSPAIRPEVAADSIPAESAPVCGCPGPCDLPSIEEVQAIFTEAREAGVPWLQHNPATGRLSEEANPSRRSNEDVSVLGSDSPPPRDGSFQDLRPVDYPVVSGSAPESGDVRSEPEPGASTESRSE